jgi:DNA topoisomerase-1
MLKLGKRTPEELEQLQLEDVKKIILQQEPKAFDKKTAKKKIAAKKAPAKKTVKKK